MNSVLRFKDYVLARLGERSSWMAIGTGVAAASALASPWSMVFLATSIIAILIPDGKLADSVKQDAKETTP